jgi:hypothetical protein
MTEPLHIGRALFAPRGLVMLAAAWIFCSWISIFGFRPPAQPQAASYSPSVHLLFIMLAVGVSIAWPLLRLSGRPSRSPMLQACFDGLALFVLLQVVIWPLRLVTNWTLARAIAVDASLAASVLTTAAVVAAVHGRASPRARTAAMAVAVLLTAAPSIAVAAGLADGVRIVAPGGGARGALMNALIALSGPTLVAQFTTPVPLDPVPAENAVIFKAFALATTLWAVVLAMRLFRPLAVASDERFDPPT